MTALQLSMWGESIPLEQVFLTLIEDSAETAALRELAKALILKKSWQQYKIKSNYEEKDLEDAFQEFCKAFNLTSKEKASEFLQKTKQSKESIAYKLLYRKGIEDLKKEIFPTKKINEYFLLNKSRKFDTIQFALIRVEEEGVALEIYHRLKDDKEDFAEVARECSSGPEALQGGLVAPQTAANLNPEIARQLSALKAGEISEPFSVDANASLYLIVKLIQIQSAKLTPQLERSLREEMFQQWMDKELTAAEVRLVEGA